jgi:hypothetical protein
MNPDKVVMDVVKRDARNELFKPLDGDHFHLFDN